MFEECDAVLHISQIRSKRVKNVRDVLEEGQDVTVWVRSVDKENTRLDVTMIEPPDLSWTEIKEGQVVTGKVIRLEKFGAFIDIGAERPGLVHISELAHDYVKSPSDVVEKGEEVEVKIIGVNRRKRQIDLSMKAVSSPQTAEETFGQEDEELPTAMALALQRALDDEGGSVSGTNIEQKSKKRVSEEQSDIIRRTLQRHQDKEN